MCKGVTAIVKEEPHLLLSDNELFFKVTQLIPENTAVSIVTRDIEKGITLRNIRWRYSGIISKAYVLFPNGNYIHRDLPYISKPDEIGLYDNYDIGTAKIDNTYKAFFMGDGITIDKAVKAVSKKIKESGAENLGMEEVHKLIRDMVEHKLNRQAKIDKGMLYFFNPAAHYVNPDLQHGNDHLKSAYENLFDNKPNHALCLIGAGAGIGTISCLAAGIIKYFG